MSPAEGVSGILVVDKPSGWTSHQVVGRVRRLVGTRKVGHAGTLDPMATGVLVVGVNRATRLLGQIMLTDKEYTATIRLGISTVTDDAEGEVVGSYPVSELSDDQLEAALTPLRGDIQQVPSAVSAIKVNGVRSYAKVRAGEQVTLAARPVRVARLEVLDRRAEVLESGPVLDLDVSVECTSGTYIRALARDLGSALGVGGHLTALRRIRVGPFDLTSAQVVDSDAPQVSLLSMPEVARLCFPVHQISADQVASVRVGRRLPDVVLSAPLTALVAPDGEFLALYRPGEGEAVPQAVFYPA